jgi:competence protein ComEA
MRPKRFLATIALCVLFAVPAAAQTTSPSKSPNSPAATAPSATGKSQLVDINSASAEELDRLPGVGPARAKAIIANRPYNGKDDLAQRKIIPSNVYSQIKDKIIARQK